METKLRYLKIPVFFHTKNDSSVLAWIFFVFVAVYSTFLFTCLFYVDHLCIIHYIYLFLYKFNSDIKSPVTDIRYKNISFRFTWNPPIIKSFWRKVTVTLQTPQNYSFFFSHTLIFRHAFSYVESRINNLKNYATNPFAFVTYLVCITNGCCCSFFRVFVARFWPHPWKFDFVNKHLFERHRPPAVLFG